MGVTWERTVFNPIERIVLIKVKLIQKIRKTIKWKNNSKKNNKKKNTKKVTKSNTNNSKVNNINYQDSPEIWTKFLNYKTILIIIANFVSKYSKEYDQHEIL